MTSTADELQAYWNQPGPIDPDTVLGLLIQVHGMYSQGWGVDILIHAGYYVRNEGSSYSAVKQWWDGRPRTIVYEVQMTDNARKVFMANQEAAQDKTTVSVSTYQERITSLLEANNAEVQRKRDALLQVAKLQNQLDAVSFWHVDMEAWLNEEPEMRSIELIVGENLRFHIRLIQIVLTEQPSYEQRHKFEAGTWLEAWVGVREKARVWETEQAKSLEKEMTKKWETQRPEDTN